ncbi:hypothetical protein D3273_20225 [Lichenibacterium minor]|uniref:Secreted protein n=1 Tax=Lichenibacterium minor TaxID=2316528 RepID=A0A4Q2U5L1_9HYPH|nr:hypothetical protein [Lichenibacterium minor]RYC30115.1 hypothetical protein D3273_20225 [Lichenibacterium minor]
MKLFASPKQATLLALVTLSTVAASLSPATAADQHRVYPGSDTAQVKQERASRVAPNLYCNKHENECQ